MPEISRFFGIIITMYWNDHNPPHFHAQYGDYEAIIGVWRGYGRKNTAPCLIYGFRMASITP